MKKQKQKTEKKEITSAVGTRGRVFEGTIIKKFPGRVVVTFERTVYVPKYERFYKKQTKLHARIPEGMELNVGDYVKVRETRKLSKIINFMVIEKVRSQENSGEKAK